MKNINVLEEIENEVMNLDIDRTERDKFIKHMRELRSQEINIMITGATGSGKSSTINAMFNTEVAKVGVGVDPETMDIEKYSLDNMVLWDTPGLGDGKEADTMHAKNIIDKLNERDKDGNALIDIVLVILDGGSRNMGTEYELINNVIIPNLGEDKDRRLIVAINQADMAMKGRNWDYENCEPNEILKDFLDEKVESVKSRIYEATGVTVEPIYYSAGYMDESGEQCKPYNLAKLLYYIVKATPEKKRAIYVNNVNSNPVVWDKNDDLEQYNMEIKKDVMASIGGGATIGAEIGATIGTAFGPAGTAIGAAIGCVVGAIGGFFASFF